jgi:hypothetical protein
MARAIDLTGQTFGRLTVRERAGSDEKNGGAMWLCDCSCGGVAKIWGSELRTSRRSCGCALAEHRKRGPGKARMDSDARIREEMREALQASGVPLSAFEEARRAWA